MSFCQKFLANPFTEVTRNLNLNISLKKKFNKASPSYFPLKKTTFENQSLNLLPTHSCF